MKAVYGECLLNVKDIEKDQVLLTDGDQLHFWVPRYSSRLILEPSDEQVSRSRPGRPFPMYNPGKNPVILEPGIYLCLYNGVLSQQERQEIDGCGFDGPAIGPLDYCHTTYGRHVKFKFSGKAALEPFSGLIKVYSDELGELWVNDDDELEFAGCQYGDWTVGEP